MFVLSKKTASPGRATKWARREQLAGGACLASALLLYSCGTFRVTGEVSTVGFEASLDITNEQTGDRQLVLEGPAIDRLSDKQFRAEYRDSAGNKIETNSGQVSSGGELHLDIPGNAETLTLSIESEAGPQGLPTGSHQTGGRDPRAFEREFLVMRWPLGSSLEFRAYAMEVTASNFWQSMQSSRAAADASLIGAPPEAVTDIHYMLDAELDGSVFAVSSTQFEDPIDRLDLTVNSFSADLMSAVVLNEAGWSRAVIPVPLSALNFGLPGSATTNYLMVGIDDGDLGFTIASDAQQ